MGSTQNNETLNHAENFVHVVLHSRCMRNCEVGTLHVKDENLEVSKVKKSIFQKKIFDAQVTDPNQH